MGVVAYWRLRFYTARKALSHLATKPRKPVLISSVLGHIEQSSYLQALAGLIAIRVVQSISVDEYEQDWNADALLLQTLFVALRKEIVPQVSRATLAFAKTLGYETVDAAEMANIVDLELSDAAATAQVEIKAAVGSLRQRLRSMADAGLSDKALASTLDAEAVTRALTQRIEAVAKSAAVSFVKAVEASAMLFAQAAKSSEAARLGVVLNWQWITMRDGKACNDTFYDSCGPRHGKSMQMEDWIKNGLPQGAFLLCSIYSRSGISQCRCFLIERGTMQGSQFGPFDMTATLKAGYTRAMTHPRFGTRKTA